MSVRKWCWGFRSAIELQHDAQMQLDDQYRLLDKLKISRENVDVELVKVAGLGNHGLHPRNCNRDLKVFLGSPNCADRDRLSITIRDDKPSRWISKYHTAQQAFIYPHKLFAYLYQNDHDKFIHQFVDPNGSNDPSKLWDEALVRNDPRLLESPLLDRPTLAR